MDHEVSQDKKLKKIDFKGELSSSHELCPVWRSKELMGCSVLIGTSCRSEEFLVIHARDDLAAVQGTTPYTHSNPGTPINMPWLGSTQTGRGASVVGLVKVF